MSRWRIVPAAADIVETDTDYTAHFDAHNVDSGSVIRIEFTQLKGGLIADVIGALRATAQLLLNVANAENGALPPLKGEDKLN